MPRACLSARPPRARPPLRFLPAPARLPPVSACAKPRFPWRPPHPIKFPSVRTSPRSPQKGKAGRPSPGPHTALPQIVVKSTMIVNAPPSPDLQSISDTFQKMGQTIQTVDRSKFNQFVNFQVTKAVQILEARAKVLLKTLNSMNSFKNQSGHFILYGNDYISQNQPYHSALKKLIHDDAIIPTTQRFQRQRDSISFPLNEKREIYALGANNDFVLIRYMFEDLELQLAPKQDSLTLFVYSYEVIDDANIPKDILISLVKTTELDTIAIGNYLRQNSELELGEQRQ